MWWLMANVVAEAALDARVQYAQKRHFNAVEAAIRPRLDLKVAIPLPSKCPSCGSRQFRSVETKHVCLYCRSEQ